MDEQDTQDRAYEIASADVVLPLTRDEANAIAETITLYVESLDADGYAEQGGDWLLQIRARILDAPGVH